MTKSVAIETGAAIEAVAKAFAGRGIVDSVQVNRVSPGVIMTSRRLTMIEKVAASRSIPLDEARRLVLNQAGITRFGEAQEIAELIAFAGSPRARG